MGNNICERRVAITTQILSQTLSFTIYALQRMLKDSQIKQPTVNKLRYNHAIKNLPGLKTIHKESNTYLLINSSASFSHFVGYESNRLDNSCN